MLKTRGLLWRTLLWVVLGALAAPLWAKDDANWQRMRAAYVKRDIDALSALRSRVPADHVLRPLADYWGLSARLPDASAEEVEAFFKQWRGSYYEDRLRNEWMRLLGQRGDWTQLLAQDRLFRMQDDDDVACWVALAQGRVHGRWLTASLQRAWDEQRVKGEGCIAAAGAFMAQGQWPQQQVFEAVREAVEYGRRREAKALADLIDPALAKAADDAIRRPERALSRANASALRSWRAEAKTWAWVRRVKRQPGKWRSWRKELQQAGLSAEQGRWVRNTLGMWMALNQDWAALQVFDARRSPADETHAEWRLRTAVVAQDWPKLLTWLQQTPQGLRDQATWRYWEAVAWQQRGGAKALQRALALAGALVDEGGYYGALAQRRFGLSPQPQPVPAIDADAMARVRQLPGLQRAQAALARDLWGQGAREWHYTIALHDQRPWPDADLRAAAQWACEQTLWDRCINTSLRIAGADALTRRYPTPWRRDLAAAAQEAEVPLAGVYGLIRQESRFVDVARSPVGASGLMQLMPGTARWTAKRMGLSAAELARWRERETNLKLGMHYFAHVLTQAGGALPVAAAAYNAGPRRAKRWLPESPMSTEVWVEGLPITETREYVQHVVHNAMVYAQVLGHATAEQTLAHWLTAQVVQSQWDPDGEDDAD